MPQVLGEKERERGESKGGRGGGLADPRPPMPPPPPPSLPFPQVLHFDTLRVKEAEFARKVQAAVKQSVAKGAAAGNLAGERQPTKE